MLRIPSHSRQVIGIAVALVLAGSLAGCFGKDSGGGADPAPTPPTDGGGTAPPTNDSEPADPTPAPEEPKPADVNVTDEGDIAGSFAKAWPFAVEAATFQTFDVTFALSGSNGAPSPLAQVNLELVDAAGTVVKSATVGVGGSGDAATWSLSPSDVVATGEWTLRAAANGETQGHLPSGGVAHYVLVVTVAY